MNIEKKLNELFTDESPSLDADNFIDNLHSTREIRARRAQRLTYGISSLVIVLLVGVLAITQLNNTSVDNQYFTESEMTEAMIDEYYDEMMVYLVEESDDIWSAMEFFYEIENETEIGE